MPSLEQDVQISAVQPAVALVAEGAVEGRRKDRESREVESGGRRRMKTCVFGAATQHTGVCLKADVVPIHQPGTTRGLGSATLEERWHPAIRK